MENKKEGAFEMIGMRVDVVKQIMESQGMPIDLDLIISITIRTLFRRQFKSFEDDINYICNEYDRQIRETVLRPYEGDKNE